MPILSITQKAIIALIIANIIWGATPPIFKWALEDVGPFTLAFLRFFLSAIILLPFLRHSKLKIEKRDWPNLFTLSFVGIFIHISFFLLGLELSSSINVPIIGSAAPIFLMIAGIFILKEKPGNKRIIGGIISLIGVLTIVLIPLIGKNHTLDASIIGNIFFVFATLSSVIHAIFLKKLTNKYQPAALLFWSFAIASFMFFPAFFNEFRAGSLANISAQGAIGILYGAIASSVIAYFCLYWSMKHLMASEVGIFTYISPAVAVLIAIPLLGEYPTPTYLFGSILVFLGIYIAEVHLRYHHLHIFHKT